MRKTLVLLLILLLVIAFVKYNPLKKDKKENGKPTVISSLTELFPNKEITLKFEEADEKYQVKVTEVKREGDMVTVITKYDIVKDKEKTTVETTYQITNEKIVESGKYIEKGKVVSIIYPMELLVGFPYENMTWKSPDNLTTYKVTNMKNNQVTIESVREIDVYETGKSKPTKKEYKEIRIFEKEKGIVLYRTEIVGDESSVFERKLVK